MSLELLLTQQNAWAADRPRRGHVLDAVDANLFQRLHPDTAAEFRKGAGGELRDGTRAAKMRSLRSSSVFACNVFDPWRGRDLKGLLSALGLTTSPSTIAFEFKARH